MRESPDKTIYTIIRTGIDIDRGWFPTPEAEGSYLSLRRARKELKQLIAETREHLDPRFNKDECGEDYWESYQDGYASACFIRLEVLSSEIRR